MTNKRLLMMHPRTTRLLFLRCAVCTIVLLLFHLLKVVCSSGCASKDKSLRPGRENKWFAEKVWTRYGDILLSNGIVFNFVISGHGRRRLWRIWCFWCIWKFWWLHKPSSNHLWPAFGCSCCSCLCFGSHWSWFNSDTTKSWTIVVFKNQEKENHEVINYWLRTCLLLLSVLHNAFCFTYNYS